MIDLPSCGGPAYKHTDLTESQCMQLNIPHSEAVRTRQMLRLEGRGMGEGIGGAEVIVHVPGRGKKGNGRKREYSPKVMVQTGMKLGKTLVTGKKVWKEFRKLLKNQRVYV